MHLNIEFTPDYSTALITLADGRTAEVGVSELTPGGEEVDPTNGCFYVVDTETAYRDEDGTVSYDGVERFDVAEYVDGLDEEKIITQAIAALGQASGITWEVDGLEHDWMKRPRTGWIVYAETLEDAIYLTRHWHRRDRIERGDRVDRALGELFRSFAPAEAA